MCNYYVDIRKKTVGFISLSSVTEEPFPSWLEEKMDLPIFDDLPPPPIPMSSQDMVVPLKPSPQPLVLPTTFSQVGSLDTVSTKSPTHFSSSKPQPKRISPVPTGSIDLVTLTPFVPCNLDSIVFKPLQKTNSLVSRIEPVDMKPLNSQFVAPNIMVVPVEHPPVLIEDLDYSLNLHDTLTPPESPKETEMEEMQVLTLLQEMQAEELDELVRIRVESLVDSPEASLESSRSSLQEESDSVQSMSSDPDCSDQEWTVAATFEIKTQKKRRACKPYSRAPPEARRERKKEQNKNAATRYRLKKKQEVEEILSEERQLQDTHDDLQSELTEVQREIKYLKNLMRDMFKAKGLVK